MLFCVVSLILRWALVKSFPVPGKAKPSQKPVQKPFPGWFPGCITTMVIQVTKSCSYSRIIFWMPGYCIGRGRSFSFKWEWWLWLRQCKCHRSLSSHLIQEILPEIVYQNLEVSSAYLLTVFSWKDFYPSSLPSPFVLFLCPFPLPFSLSLHPMSPYAADSRVQLLLFATKKFMVVIPSCAEAGCGWEDVKSR